MNYRDLLIGLLLGLVSVPGSVQANPQCSRTMEHFDRLLPIGSFTRSTEGYDQFSVDMVTQSFQLTLRDGNNKPVLVHFFLKVRPDGKMSGYFVREIEGFGFFTGFLKPVAQSWMQPRNQIDFEIPYGRFYYGHANWDGHSFKASRSVERVKIISNFNSAAFPANGELKIYGIEFTEAGFFNGNDLFKSPNEAEYANLLRNSIDQNSTGKTHVRKYRFDGTSIQRTYVDVEYVRRFVVIENLHSFKERNER